MHNARVPTLVSVLAAVTLLTACRPHRPPTPTTRLATAPTASPSTRPTTRMAILDIRRGTGSFPLATTRPVDTVDSLADSLRDGYLARLTPAAPDFLTLAGDLPALDLLRVDVSRAHMRSDYRPFDFDKSSTTERTLTVHRLEYVADPLHYDAASARIRLTADDARLDLIRDAKNARGLVLAGARRGTFDFHAAAKDLSAILSFAPGRAGGKASKLTVVRSEMTFASDDPHTLSATLDLRARWVLLPMTLTLAGRVTASPDGTLTFSDLSATGYDPGGLLAAAFLGPALKKMDGLSQPVCFFPDPQTHVTDVRFSTADGLSVTIEFGAAPPGDSPR